MYPNYTIITPHSKANNNYYEKRHGKPSRDSPFKTEEDSLFMTITPPPRCCNAAANEPDVRVLGS